MRFSYILIALLGLFYWSGCNIINPKEPTPTYVHIDSFAFKTTSLSFGSSSHDISCVWVYYNNNPVGVFDLPATFPVITSGDTGKIIAVPGITVDGLKYYQNKYPFYTFDSTTLITAPGKVVDFKPKTQYWSTTKVLVNEDFELGNNFNPIKYNDTNTVPMTVTSDSSMVFEGNRSGYIHIQAPDSTSESVERTFFSYPTNDAYIEINYKSNIPLVVGVAVYNVANDANFVSPDYIVGINPSPNEWKKMYISLSPTAQALTSQLPGGYFRVLVKGFLSAGKTDGYVLIDNVKVVTN